MSRIAASSATKASRWHSLPFFPHTSLRSPIPFQRTTYDNRSLSGASRATVLP
jgi:hypothetical protein